MTSASGQSLWSATTGPYTSAGSLRDAVRAEVAIVGAGYTGLSAALHLAESGRDVVAIDARGIGEGASGLNGGQVIPGLKQDPDELAHRFGEDVVATVAGGPDRVFSLIDRLHIECDAVRSGWLQAATSETACLAIEKRARQWLARGADVACLSDAETARLTGSSRYQSGWIDRRGGTLHPLKYLHGLAAAVQRAGGRLHARSAAISLERAGDEWRVRTPQGEIRSRFVVLATNAYSGLVTEPLQRTVVAVPSMQVATAPLSAQMLRQVLPQRQSVSDTWRLLRYFRLDAGGRLIMGSRGVYGDVAPEKAARLHYRAVREIYPQLDGIAFEHHWSGLVAMTPDHLPHLHEMAPGLLSALGYNGRGVAMATTMGALLARWIGGEPPAQLGFPVTPVQPIRLHRFSRLGVGALIQYYHMLDAISSIRARRR